MKLYYCPETNELFIFYHGFGTGIFLNQNALLIGAKTFRAVWPHAVKVGAL